MPDSTRDRGTWPSQRLPNTWEWVDFGEVFRNSTSSTKKLKQKDYSEQGSIAVVDQGAKLVGGFTDNTDLAYKGDLPVVVFGDHTRCVKFIDFPFVQGADGVKVLEPLELYYPAFAHQALRSIDLPDKGYSRHYKFVTASQFPLPPLNEQRRIVAKIEELTTRSRRAREALEAVPPLLEQLRQSVLAAAFSGRLTADWRKKNPDVEPASVLLERIRAERRRRWEENELAKLRAKGKEPKDDHWKAKYKEPEPVDPTGLPDLPEGWCWAAAEEIVEPDAEIVYGIVQPGREYPGGVPYVRGKDIVDGKILIDQLRKTNPKIAARYARASLRGGDVLLGIIRATKVAIVPEKLEGANLTQGTARLRPSLAISTGFLASWLDSPFAQDWLHDHYRGIDMPGLNLRDVRRLPVPLAPIAEQQASEASVDLLLERHKATREAHETSLSNIGSIDQSVLAKAFRGELVPQDPNDEPASVLLDRIRAQRAAAKADTKRGISSRPLRLRGQDENRKDANSAENPTTDDDPLQTVLHFLQSNPGPHSKQDILTNTNLDPTTWSTVAPELANHPNIDRTGIKRGTRYEWKDR